MSGASRRTARSVGERLALAVTYIVSPLSLPPVVVAVAAHALGAGGREVATAAALALVFAGLLPLSLLAAMVRRGEAQTLEVRERVRRTKPYLAGALGNALLGASLLAVLPPARQIVGALALWQAATVLALLAVNRSWKISAHAVATAGAFSSLLALRLIFGVPVGAAALAALAFAVPLVAWARLRLTAHTPAQVLAGALVGLVLPPVQLLLWPGA